jgi:hypothetical protein
MRLKGRIRQIARRQAALGLMRHRGQLIDLRGLNIEDLNRLKCLRIQALAEKISGRPAWSVLSSLELDEIRRIFRSSASR